MKKYKAIVFDMGGTLMEYEGMPMNWSGFYRSGFEKVSELNGLKIPDEEIERACEVMSSFNPRISGRLVEIAPEVIFRKAMESWDEMPPVEKVVYDFFSGMELKPRIFEYTHALLDGCRKQGMKIACLTDLPTGMPDAMFRSAVEDIVEALDLYVSSSTCGFRKPSRETLEYVSDRLGVGLDEILFVGDEEKDQQTAENAGCDFMYIYDFR